MQAVNVPHRPCRTAALRPTRDRRATAPRASIAALSSKACRTPIEVAPSNARKHPPGTMHWPARMTARPVNRWTVARPASIPPNATTRLPPVRPLRLPVADGWLVAAEVVVAVRASVAAAAAVVAGPVVVAAAGNRRTWT